MKAVDKANGYIFRTDEERNVQKLLSAAMTNREDELNIDETSNSSTSYT